jgi:peptidoglycan/xylan/chitin deacetylase (PgdA/CDA1 family)
VGPIPVAAQLVTRGHTDRHAVELTFDAGADLGHADAILDTLHAAGIRASFGVTGAWVSANPVEARRMVADGHLLIDHTQDHRSFTGVSTASRALSSAQRRAEVTDGANTISTVSGGHTAPWFRPPYGDTDLSVQRDVAAVGYRYEVLWTVDSLGWRGLPPDAIVRRCINGAQPGAILMFHVGSRSQDWLALPAVIFGLRARGYDFLTIDQML